MPSACRARSTSAGPGWRWATSAGPELTAERFVPTRFGRRRALGARQLDRNGAWRAPLPLRRPRAVPAGRRPRVPGPHRPPGQDPRLPHRAGGDRGGAGALPGSARGGGARRARTRAARDERRLVAYVVAEPGADARPGELRAHLAGVAARLHAAVGPGAPRRAAADRQRQGGPPGPARPGGRRRWPARDYVEPAGRARSASWPASCARCSGSSASGRTTTSSRWAATRSAARC